MLRLLVVSTEKRKKRGIIVASEQVKEKDENVSDGRREIFRFFNYFLLRTCAHCPVTQSAVFAPKSEILRNAAEQGRNKGATVKARYFGPQNDDGSRDSHFIFEL